MIERIGQEVIRGHHLLEEVPRHGQVDIITQLIPVVTSLGPDTVRQHLDQHGDHSRRLRVHTGHQHGRLRDRLTVILDTLRIITKKADTKIVDRILGNQAAEI